VDEHPGYQKQHRQQNPKLVESNRQRQRLRDRKRRVELLVRNNLALDLKHSASEVWLLGPKVRNLDRNNLASAQVLILPSLGHSPESISKIRHNHDGWLGNPLDQNALLVWGYSKESF
jgi:hypothetical protein